MKALEEPKVKVDEKAGAKSSDATAEVETVDEEDDLVIVEDGDAVAAAGKRKRGDDGEAEANNKKENRLE